MVKLTKADENKLGQILKELNEMRDVLKGGEGSGVRGHKTPDKTEGKRYRFDDEDKYQSRGFAEDE